MGWFVGHLEWVEVVLRVVWPRNAYKCVKSSLCGAKMS